MFLYTALGDSITAGEGASRLQLAYPSRVVSHLRAEGEQATGQVVAEPGWTSEALTAYVLDHLPLAVVQAEAVSIWVGGDDLAQAGLAILRGASPNFLQQGLARYGQDLQVLIGTIRKVGRARVILCTQYNPFPNSPPAVQAIGNLNAVTSATAARLGTALAPAHEWFAGREAELIAGYRTGQIQDALQGPMLPIHPNDRGHAVIAQGLEPLVR